ncbi:cytochrome C [Sulfurimonas sp. SAG-AH-194-I05]|nr:cytochrome C [Sulfurimonas sp. SAG-AH-194-I05]MDF1874633.1 cytochrome C [Sulfurimonas sp. SAG-AH-194-I05]
MKKTTSLLLAAIVASSMFSTSAMASAKKGQKFYLKKLKVCKKDGLKNGALFAVKHNRAEWAKIKDDGALITEWTAICPHGEKKFSKMKEKHMNNLYDFVWKYASDGDAPSCG